MKNVSKKYIVILLLIAIIAFKIFIDNYNPYEKLFAEMEFANVLSWSSYDIVGNKSICGFRPYDLRWGEFKPVILDYLDNDEYVGLSYPYQFQDIVYYTSKIKETEEACIVSRYGGNTELILKKHGNITYKKISENNLYYLYANALWKYNLTEKIDELIIGEVDEFYGFDIDEKGRLLYTSKDGNIQVYDTGESKIITEGRVAKFIDSNNIVFANEDKILTKNLTAGDEKVIKKGVKCINILLTPSRTSFFYIHQEYPPTYLDEGHHYDKLGVMMTNGKHNRNIPCLPKYTYGMELLDYYNDYYINHTVKLFSNWNLK